MRWKQFFTPVKSMTAEEARSFMGVRRIEHFTLLDVRQPDEYKSEHIPGAKLIPLPELDRRLNEISADKPTIVYCAIGGRSRVAAQILAGKGFSEVINLTGGIKAWNGRKAIGEVDQGLALFSGKESLEETLVVAYSLEAGLQEFYLEMMQSVKDAKARELFNKLSDIERKHQQRVYEAYRGLTGTRMNQDEFAREKVFPAMEGGLTTQEYMAIYQPNMEVATEVISLAMVIEAQALDLYQRAAERAENDDGKTALIQIAEEERTHLALLGKLFEH